MLATRMRMASEIQWALEFGAAADRVTVSDHATIQNIFDGGGFVEATIRADGMGGNNFGRIYDNGVGGFLVVDLSGGDCALRFSVNFSTTDGIWTTDNRVITIGQIHLVRVEYNSGATANNPVIYVDGVSAGAISRTQAPVGTRTSSAGNALILGNNVAQNRVWDGRIYNMQFNGGARWPMNEGSGDTVIDNSINNNHGTIVGADWVLKG